MAKGLGHAFKILESKELNALAETRNEDELHEACEIMHTTDSSYYETFHDGLNLAVKASGRPVVVVDFNYEFQYYFIGTLEEVKDLISKMSPDNEDDEEV